MKAPLAPRDGFPCLPLFWFRQTIYWITQLWCTSCFNSLPTKFNPISARKDRLLFIHQIVSKKGIEKNAAWCTNFEHVLEKGGIRDIPWLAMMISYCALTYCMAHTWCSRSIVRAPNSSYTLIPQIQLFHDLSNKTCSGNMEKESKVFYIFVNRNTS